MLRYHLKMVGMEMFFIYDVIMIQRRFFMRKRVRKYLRGGSVALLFAIIFLQVPVRADWDHASKKDNDQVFGYPVEKTGVTLYAGKQKSHIRLKINKTYTTYDVTSDGRPDKLLIKCDKSGGYDGKGSFSVYINGKLCFKRNENRIMTLTAELYTLKNRKTYLNLDHRIDNGVSTYDKILTYRKGKLVTAVDLLSHIKNARVHMYAKEFKQVKGDKISFYVGLQPMGVGQVDYVVTYRPSGYRLKPDPSVYPLAYRSTSYYEAKNQWVVASNKYLNVHPRPGKGKVSFVVSGGQKVSLNKICYKNSLVYIQISGKINGRRIKGWINCPDFYTDPFFTNSRFTG